MTPNDYQAGVLRTECKYEPALERIKQNPWMLAHLRKCAALGREYGKQLDLFKRAVFYGKELNQEQKDQIQLAILPAGMFEESICRLEADNLFLMSFLHSPVGLSTEAVELFEMTTDAILNDLPFDQANAVEELGDSSWFIAAGASRVGKTLTDVHITNNKKLLDKEKGRYKKGAFSLEECDNRDLASERALLEEAVAV